MKTSRKYLVAVGLLAVLALVFGVFGTFAPPLAEEGSPVQPQQGSSSESVGHFQNPPTYDSGWIDIRNKTGQYVTLYHGLNTTEAVVDITGRQSLEPIGGALAWSKKGDGDDREDQAQSVIQTGDGGYAVAGFTYMYGGNGMNFWLIKTDEVGRVEWNRTYDGGSQDYAESVVQTVDGGYALAGYTYSWDTFSYEFWLVKTDSFGYEQWNKTYGGADDDQAYSLVETADGGYALAGYTDSFGAGGDDFWLVKTDAIGNHLWNKTYGGTSQDWAESLIKTRDGGYALAGHTDSYGWMGDFWLVKTDSNGIVQWNKTYTGAYDDWAYSVVQTFDGGYALAGQTHISISNDDFWLVKTDGNGNKQWSRSYGGSTYDWAESVIQTRDGGYALAGPTRSFGAGDYDFWLVRTDGAGNAQWNRTYGEVDNDRPEYVIQTGDGGYALAGYTYQYDSYSNDFWLIKLDAEIPALDHKQDFGSRIFLPGWSQTYGGTGYDIAESVIQTSDGGYAIAGSTDSSDVNGDFWLVKTDSVGAVVWTQTYGGAGLDYAESVIQTTDGGYAIAGYTNSFTSYDCIWLVKTDSSGNEQWNRYWGSSISGNYATCVVETGDGGYALAGYTYTESSDVDFYLVKLDSSGIPEWDYYFGGAEAERAYSVLQTGDGGYALAGYTDSYGAGDFDMWLVKTDANGVVQWNKTYTGTSDDGAYSLVQSFDGGYAIVGQTYNPATSSSDFWLIKTDSSGNAQWNRTYGGTLNDFACSLLQTNDGGYAMAGYCGTLGSSGSRSDFWFVRTDVLGKMQWSKAYGGASWDCANSVALTADGGYVLAGYTRSYGAGSDDYWLVKTDVELGFTMSALSNDTVIMYRGQTDLYWNYMRVRIWIIEEPSWIYGDINMDGVVDAKDLYIVGRNYGKTFSLLSLSGIVAIAGIRTVKKRKQNKQPD